MFVNKRKLFASLLLGVALSFVLLFVGGELLHTQIHPGHTASSHDQCPIYQLQAQSFLLSLAVVTAVLSRIVTDCIIYSPRFISQNYFNSSLPRAPPISSFHSSIR